MEFLWISPFEIVRLKRNVRIKLDDNSFTTKYIDSNSYIVRFKSCFSPPSFVIYMGKRLVLEPFKRLECQKCQRFGYISRICRSSDSNFVCVRCGKNLYTHDAEKCIIDKPSCINCKRNKLLDLEHEASSTS